MILFGLINLEDEGTTFP